MKKKAHNIVINRLLNDIILPVKKIKENDDGSVAIKCANKEHPHIHIFNANKEDVEKMGQLLIDKVGHDFNVKQEELENPRLQVYNIDNSMDKEELEADINERNFEGTNYFCIVEYLCENKKNEKDKCNIKYRS